MYEIAVLALTGLLVVAAVIAVLFSNRQRSPAPYVVPPRVARSGLVGVAATPLSATPTMGSIVSYDTAGFAIEASVIYADQVYFLASNSEKLFILHFSPYGTEPVIAVPGPVAGARSLSISDDGEVLYLTANDNAYSARIGAPVLLNTPGAVKAVRNSILGSNDGVRSIDIYDRGDVSVKLSLTWFAPSSQFGTAFDVATDRAVVADAHQVYVFRLSTVWYLERSYPEAGVFWLFINRLGGFYVVTEQGHASYSDSGTRSDTVRHPTVQAAAGGDGTLVIATGRAIVAYRGKNSVSAPIDCSRCVGLAYDNGRVYFVQDTKRFQINV